MSVHRGSTNPLLNRFDIPGHRLTVAARSLRVLGTLTLYVDSSFLNQVGINSLAGAIGKCSYTI